MVPRTVTDLVVLFGNPTVLLLSILSILSTAAICSSIITCNIP